MHQLEAGYAISSATVIITSLRRQCKGCLWLENAIANIYGLLIYISVFQVTLEKCASLRSRYI